MAQKTLAALAVAVAATGGVLMPAVSQAQVAYNAGVVSDYRYRGISQTRLEPALQGGVDYTAGAFYVGAWASTIKWVKDATVAGTTKTSASAVSSPASSTTSKEIRT